MSQRKVRSRRAPISRGTLRHGFELGDHQGAVIVPNIDFNKALSHANIFACAYGYGHVDGFPSAVPFLTLVGKNPGEIRRAFDQFAAWGCEEDGDVVDIQILLRSDGTYVVAVSPEFERAMHRMVPHHQLIRPIILSLFWIKTFDSTNPFLPRLGSYIRSPLTPVVVGAGTVADAQPLSPSSIIPLAGDPRFVKFELKINSEAESSDHWLVNVGKGNNKRRRPKPDSETLSAQEIARLRQKTIDIAFPVSRERIRRARLSEAVRIFPGFEEVDPRQVQQAAINLVVSAEVCQGEAHFAGLGPDFKDVIWKHIFRRVETTHGPDKIAALSPGVVAAQLELDVAAALRRRGLKTKGIEFSKLQRLFRREGYVGD